MIEIIQSHRLLLLDRDFTLQPDRAKEFVEEIKKHEIEAPPSLPNDDEGYVEHEYKSIRIMVPIQERGNSSAQLRMIHRQWYHKIQRELDEGRKIQTYQVQGNIRVATELSVKIELQFVLVDPAARSKASTQDKMLGDLFASSQRVFKNLPDDLFENFKCCTDVLILLHTSFILVTVEGFHQLRKVLVGEEEAICFNQSEERCLGDSIALGKEIQLRHANKVTDLTSSLRKLNNQLTVSMMNSDAAITQYSIAGMKSTFMTKIETIDKDDNGFNIPAQYYGEGPNSLEFHLLQSPMNPCSGRATHLFFIESRANRGDIRERVRKYLLSDGAQMAGTFEIYFIIGRNDLVPPNSLKSEQSVHNDLLQIDLAENHESFTTQAHLAGIAFGAKCTNIDSVTHLKDVYKLNIRRLFKEVLTPGIKSDSFICLDALLRGLNVFIFCD